VTTSSEQVSSEQVWDAVPLVPGRGVGPTLVLSEPLNAWGGLDPTTGRIVHHSHPQRGADVAGTVLVLEETRGSGTNAQVLAQTWAEGHGPVAVVLARPDYVLCVGAVVSQELYGVTCPVVVLDSEHHGTLTNGLQVEVDASGESATVTVRGSVHTSMC
jgi:predicted aconitase with swiveling domain